MSEGKSEWVFGYGSLLYRPDIPFVERRPAFVSDWVRRFWQGSPDHRGSPERPGRVVTLLRWPGKGTWGMAYRLDPAVAEQVYGRLDEREQAGYQREEVPLSTAPGEAPFAVGTTWLATVSNPNFLGTAAVDTMVAEVSQARGLSGANTDYVLDLAEALRGLSVREDPAFELEAGLRSRFLVPATIDQLLEVHTELSDMLEQVCWAVLLEAPCRFEWFEAFDHLLRWHVESEERWLLPEFEARVEDVPANASSAMIRRDHERIVAALEPGLDGERSSVLIRLRRLHHLLEHHDQREEAAFRTRLDEVLPAALRATYLARITAARPMRSEALDPIEKELPREAAAPPQGSAVEMVQAWISSPVPDWGQLVRQAVRAEAERAPAIQPVIQTKLLSLLEEACSHVGLGEPLLAIDQLTRVLNLLERARRLSRTEATTDQAQPEE